MSPAERDPLLPYSSFGSSLRDGGWDFQRRRGAPSPSRESDDPHDDDVEGTTTTTNEKSLFSFSSSLLTKKNALTVLVASLLFFSGAAVGGKSFSSSSSSSVVVTKSHRLGNVATIQSAPGQKTLAATLLMNKNNNKNNNNNNNNNKNGTSENEDAQKTSDLSEESSGGREGESEEDAYKSLMEMFGLFAGNGALAREAIQEPEPSLSAMNQDLLQEEKKHFSKIGSDLGYFRAPSIRNDTLVFVSEGSIWLSHVKGGPAARISSSYSYESVPKISPDGKRIAFLAESADGFEVFELPISGGVARQVTHGAQAYGLPQWASDDELLILTTQFSDLGLPQLAKVDALTGKVSVLPFEKAHGGSKDSKGCYLFYPLRQSSSTKRYEGGEQARIWRWCGPGAIGANGTAWAEA